METRNTNLALKIYKTLTAFMTDFEHNLIIFSLSQIILEKFIHCRPTAITTYTCSIHFSCCSCFLLHNPHVLCAETCTLTRSPLGPSGPCDPSAPLRPFSPGDPASPIGPICPLWPCWPGFPGGPYKVKSHHFCKKKKQQPFFVKKSYSLHLECRAFSIQTEMCSN